MGDLAREIYEDSIKLSSKDMDEMYENDPKTLVINEDNDIEDIIAGMDGMHNIQPPEGWVEPPDEPAPIYEKTCETCERLFFYTDVISEIEKVPPYISDEIRLPFSPEDVYILMQYLKMLCIDIKENMYLTDHKGISDLYQQQEYLRFIISSIEETFDEYTEKRPFTPFLAPWLKRINKYHIRNKSA